MSKVYLPASMKELWACLTDHPDAALFAGGTDLFVKMRAEKTGAAVLIGLERIAELRNIREDRDAIRIGAAVPHDQILHHPAVVRHLPLLCQAIATLGSPPIRAMGTIGGNLCTASPAGDTLPPLYVLQAEVEIASPSGTRRLPVADFICGPGRTRLKAGDVLTAVHIPKPAVICLQHFEKVGQRKSMACAIASLAALIRLSASKEILAARLAWGSVGPTVVTSTAIEEYLTGKKLSPETLAGAAEAVSGIVTPIDDIRASADYRRNVSGNVLLRLPV